MLINNTLPGTDPTSGYEEEEISFVSTSNLTASVNREKRDSERHDQDIDRQGVENSQPKLSPNAGRQQTHDQKDDLRAEASHSDAAVSEDTGEHSDSTDSSNTTNESRTPTPSSLSARKSALVEDLMEYFSTLFPTCCRSTPGIKGASGLASSQEHTNETEQSNSQSGSPSQSAPRGTNRNREDKQSDDTADENGDGEPLRKRSKKANANNINMPKLACPYFKRDPRKYQISRSCPGPGWETMHRLK
jgi:hypothetical protein